MPASRNMVDVVVGYPSQGKVAVVSPAAGQQLNLFAAHLLNRSGSASDVAALVLLAQAAWKFGTYPVGGPAVDATAAIQAGTVQNLFTTVNNTGFVAQATKPFGLLGFTISQAQTGAPTYQYQYFNGTAFVNLPATIALPSFTATGDTLLVFAPPVDWVPGTTGTVGGTVGLYTLFALATTAPTTAVQATAAWFGRMLAYAPSIPNTGQLSLQYSDLYPRILDSLEGFLPYFGTASAKNMVTLQYFSVK